MPYYGHIYYGYGDFLANNLYVLLLIPVLLLSLWAQFQVSGSFRRYNAEMCIRDRSVGRAIISGSICRSSLPPLSGPVLTHSSTVLPAGTCVVAVGFCRITRPASTVSLASSWTSTSRPSTFFSWSSAQARSLFVKSISGTDVYKRQGLYVPTRGTAL